MINHPNKVILMEWKWLLNKERFKEEINSIRNTFLNQKICNKISITLKYTEQRKVLKKKKENE